MEVGHLTKSKASKILTPNLNFEDSGKIALYSVIIFIGPSKIGSFQGS